MRARTALHSFLAVGLVFGALVGACGSDSDGTVPPTDDGGAPDVGIDANDGGTPVEDAGSPGLHPTFTFESGPVRPVALSPDGTTLFVANTPNASLDIFKVSATGLTPAGSVSVGIDPVAVAARTNTEVWVVNHISDSVSIVDTSVAPHVVRTLLVGDEPSDIVFGGPGKTRAFITTAHRGQQRTDPSIASVPGAGDPQLTTAGIGRADVWVFDAAALGTNAGGTPLSIVTLFGDTPRALAVTPDGNTVYAAVFNSGNASMATSPLLPCAGFDTPTTSTPCTVSGVSVPGAPPGPGTNHAGITAPRVAMILKSDTSDVWRDVYGRDWTAATAFSLPDQDVFAIDTSTLAMSASYRHVGTTLFGMAVNPVNGNVYVSNTEARNDLRFEGPGTYASTTLQGHLAESRITVLSGTDVTPRHLNKHIDYAALPAPSGTASHSLATPLDIVVSADGAKLYVSAYGSSKIGVFPTTALENDTFDPVTQSASYISVSGGGPGGLVLDAARNRMYVSTRFDDGVSVIDLGTGKETSHVRLANPEPKPIAEGRSFLYDAVGGSSNGEAACASCHMFGGDDHLVWDLGNPDADATENPINIKLKIGAPGSINGTGSASSLHPMKGPMTTQTLKGTVNHGPMHWRGDRVSGFFGTDSRTAPPFDSQLAFKNFIVAFNGLLGLGPEFSTTQMQSFTAFALSMQLPPNAVRALDNSLDAQQAAGKNYFLGCDGLDSLSGKPVSCPNGVAPASGGHQSDGVPGIGFTCQGCHVLDPAQGFFGTDGESTFEALPQIMKVPQLRNLYDKIGMFGAPDDGRTNAGDNGHKGAQIRGVGFTNDGSVDTLFRFFQGTVFNAASNGRVGFAGGDTQRRAVEQFMLAFEGDLAPIVGQQVTLRSDNATAAGSLIDLFEARAAAPFVSKLLGGNSTECTLIAQVVVSGTAVTYVFRNGAFVPDNNAAPLTSAALRALAAAPGQEITYTCMPPGWRG